MPTVRDSQLFEKLESALPGYLEFLRTETRSGALVIPRVLVARIEFTSGGFSVDEEWATAYSGLVAKALSALRGNPQFDERLNILLATPSLSRFLRVSSGAAEPTTMNLEISLLSPFLTRYLKTLPKEVAEAMEFDQATFANVYNELEEYLLNDNDKYRIATLLVNFEMGRSKFEIGPFVIRLLDNREVVELNQILPDYRAMPIPFPFEIPRFALELTVSVPRGSPPGTPLTLDKIWWIVCCLELCRRGVVFYNDVWYFPDPWSPYPGVSRQISKRAAAPGPKFVLGEQDIPILEQLWKSLEKHVEKPPPFWLVAFHRFYESTLRGRLEDRLIDSWIACEALFGAGVEMGEMRYQLSLRLAHFLEGDPTKRRATFDFAKEAYKWRGKVVHGSPKLHPQKLRSMADGMEDLVRRSLARCVLDQVVSQESLIESIEKSILGF